MIGGTNFGDVRIGAGNGKMRACVMRVVVKSPARRRTIFARDPVGRADPVDEFRIRIDFRMSGVKTGDIFARMAPPN